MHVAAQMNKPDVGNIFDGLGKDGSSLLTYHPDLSIHDVYGLKAIHYCAYENVQIENKS